MRKKTFKKISNEFKALFLMSLPLVAAQLGQTLIGVADAVMAGRISSADLAAVSVGESIWFPLATLVLSILMAITPFTARYFGSKKYDQLSPITYQGLLLAVFLGVGCFFLVRNCSFVFNYMGIDGKLANLTQKYLEAVSWGIPAFAGYQVFRSVSEGLGKMWTVTFVSFLSLAVNVPLNYVFIYGKLGFPAMGGVGCGWASSITMWVMFFVMAWVVFSSKGYRKFGLNIKITRPDFKLLSKLLKIGVPIGLAIFAEAGIFSVIALFVARYGSDVVSAHQIAISFAVLMFMVPLGISMAVTVRVGHALGRGRKDEARLSAFTGLGAAAVFSIFSCAIYLSFPRYIASMYTNIPEVIEIASGLFVYAAAFQLSDSVQACVSGALRGYKDATVPMFIVVISYWGVCVPAGAWFGLEQQMGIEGFWASLVVGLTIAALFLFLRLYQVSRENYGTEFVEEKRRGLTPA